jgi:DNA polymerase-3 subunit epsilon
VNLREGWHQAEIMDRRSFLTDVLSSSLIAAFSKRNATAEIGAPISSRAALETVPAAQNTRLALKINTTGITPQYGHHIFEIAGVKIAGDTMEGLCFHQYLKPPRKSAPLFPSYGAPPWFLRDDYSFGEIAHGLVECLRGVHIVTHNARLELAFVDHELGRAGLKSLRDYCASITDTMIIGRQLFGSGARFRSIDVLCQYLGLAAPGTEIYRSGSMYAEVVAQTYIAFQQPKYALN